MPTGQVGNHLAVPRHALYEESVVWVVGRGDSGTLRRRGYRVKPRDGHHASAAGRRSQCQRGVMRIRKRLQRLEQRARAGRVEPPEERTAMGFSATRCGTLFCARWTPGTASSSPCRPPGTPRRSTSGVRSSPATNRLGRRWRTCSERGNGDSAIGKDKRLTARFSAGNSVEAGAWTAVRSGSEGDGSVIVRESRYSFRPFKRPT